MVFEAIRGPDGKDNSVTDLPFNWDPSLDISGSRIGYFARSFEERPAEDDADPDDIEYYTKLRELGREVLELCRSQGFDLYVMNADGSGKTRLTNKN